jgi:hypothetical protein
MFKRIWFIASLSLALSYRGHICAAQPVAGPTHKSAGTPTTESVVLNPPVADGPVVVQARFHLDDINAIDDGSETFEFRGVLTLTWRDPRQEFDAAAAGVDEKLYQGDFQFNEIAPSWFPQVVLVNESGMYETHGVLLRAKPDGTQILVQTVNAIAKTEFSIRRFPFDQHQLEAVFEILGFDDTEVVLETDTEVGDAHGRVQIPQWTISSVCSEIRNRAAPYAGRRGVASALVVSVDARRESFYIIRLVVIPLIVIVLLSFSVFWMDRSSLGDRINVSFIGILTGVAYQIVVSDLVPRISYSTLIHGFLNLSFILMCATVAINLIVGSLDQKGKSELGNRIDRRCRWIFPLVYFSLNGLMVGAAFLFY